MNSFPEARPTAATGRRRRADASSQPAAAPLRQGAPPGTASRRRANPAPRAMAQPAPLSTGETLAAVYDRLAALAPAQLGGIESLVKMFVTGGSEKSQKNAAGALSSIAS